jgi:hypothetical protein
LPEKVLEPKAYRGKCADFTNLIYRFASYGQTTGLTPDVHHAARRLDKSSFANVMARFLLVDH